MLVNHLVYHAVYIFVGYNKDGNKTLIIMRKYLLQVAENIYDYINPVVVCNTPEIITVSY